MPISISDFATPKWVKLNDRYPLSYNKEDRFNETNPMLNANRHMGNVGRDGGWKLPGYNLNHNSTRTEVIRVRSDSITIKPY